MPRGNSIRGALCEPTDMPTHTLTDYSILPLIFTDYFLCGFGINKFLLKPLLPSIVLIMRSWSF